MSGSSTAPLAIEVSGLTKTYGDQFALRRIDLKVRRGERVVLFGPNGAGKTTLIKVLAAIVRPTSGKVAIDGIELKDRSEEARRHIGVVTHQTFLYSHLSVYENLDFFCRIYAVPRRRERIAELVRRVEMSARLHDRVDSLSRGMQQRVSIARAMVHEPSVLLLDEPETGLDQRTVGIVRSVLLGPESEQRAVVLITHNLESGMEVGDRFVFLDRGRVVRECGKSEIDLKRLKDIYSSATGATL